MLYNIILYLSSNVWVWRYFQILHIIVFASQNDNVSLLGRAGSFVPVVHKTTSWLEAKSGPDLGLLFLFPPILLPLWGFVILVKSFSYLVHWYSHLWMMAIIFVLPHREIIRIKWDIKWKPFFKKIISILVNEISWSCKHF